MTNKERRARWRAEHREELQRKYEARKLRRIVHGRSPYTTLRHLHFIGPDAIAEVRVRRTAAAHVTRAMESAGFRAAHRGEIARRFFELKLRRAALGTDEGVKG